MIDVNEKTATFFDSKVKHTYAAPFIIHYRFSYLAERKYSREMLIYDNVIINKLTN